MWTGDKEDLVHITSAYEHHCVLPYYLKYNDRAEGQATRFYTVTFVLTLLIHSWLKFFFCADKGY